MPGTQYDVFLSYNWGSKSQVKEIYDKLVDSGLNVWRDDNKLINSDVPLSGQLANAIRNSKIFLCFITKKYSESHNCNLEIEYANTLRKKIMVLMIEPLEIEELDAVGFLIKYNLNQRIILNNKFNLT